MKTELKIPNGRGKNRIKQMKEFGANLIKIGNIVGFKVSARGWCYQLEIFRLINKDEFNKVENLINECRKQGHIPIDFTAQDIARKYNQIIPDDEDVREYINGWINYFQTSISKEYVPDFWKGQKYYLQLLVEKVDLKTLFAPICEELQIPLANARGWNDINSRAELIERFKQAEERGQIPVLLYCGDYDPAGLEISNTIRKNLNDLSKATEWDTTNLVIDRFGLNRDFIIENNLTWINNLITGTKGYIAIVKDGQIVQGKTKAGRPHPDFNKPSVQEYLKLNGVKKCEANALVVIPRQARELFWDTIHKYISKEDIKSYQDKVKRRREEIDKILGDKEINDSFKDLKTDIKKWEEEDDGEH